MTTHILDSTNRDEAAVATMLLTDYVGHSLQEVGAGLPLQLRRCLNEYYVGRVRRSGGLPRMGEEVLLLCADLFRIDEHTVRHIASPWACLYVNCLMIDDLIDMPGRHSASCAILVQHLADEGYRLLRDIFGSDAVFWEQLQEYRLQSWRAITSEMMSWPRGRECSPRALALEQGKKAAMAKACAAALVHGSYGVALTEQQEHGLDCLCAGVQLLDDVQDFREDHDAQRRNLLLTRGEAWLGQGDAYSPFREFREQSLLCALLLSGSLCESWVLAGELLEESMNLLGGTEMSATEGYFRGLARECRTSASHLHSILSLNHDWTMSIARAFQESESAVEALLRTPRGERPWLQLQKVFSRGPVAAN